MNTLKNKELKEEFEQIISQLFDISGDLFKIERNNSWNINLRMLSDFFIFSSRPQPEIVDVWKISDGESFFFLCLISYETIISLKSIVHTGNHQYFYGFIKTQKDFGKTLIRPETWADKISELFNKIEIDFKEHRSFSRKYYCISKTPEKLKSSINYELMDFINKQKYIEIEFCNKYCLFRLRHSIANRNEALKFIFTGCELSKILNPTSMDFR